MDEPYNPGYGCSAERKVLYIGYISFTISLVMLILSIVFISQATKEGHMYYKHPVLAINVLAALYCISVSIYQIIISILLSWQGIWTKGNIFLCTLWYVSHLSILTFYSMFFAAMAIISLNGGSYWITALTIIWGIAYNGVFIYFCIAVNSYIHSLVREGYF